MTLSLIENKAGRADEREKTIVTLVADIMSQKLNFFEEAEAIRKLIDNCGLTQEEAALKLGRVQSTIANKLRLLRLTPEERQTIMRYKLTERHARALLRIASSEDRLIMLEKIVDERLKVDRTEQLIDEYIGSDNRRQRYRKRSNVFRNITGFVNMIHKAVENMKSSGIEVETSEIKGDDYVEYRVRIPRIK